MKKKDIVYHLKGRWKDVYKIELQELRKTSFKDRISQTETLFSFGSYLKISDEPIEESTETNWQRLKDYYNEHKESKVTH
jgi:hypothetical protein